MLKSKQNNNPLSNVKSVITIEQLQKARDITEEIYVSDKVYEYIVALAKATREHPAVKLGLSPRGTIALTNVTKATALLKGRNYALPDDVLYSFYDTIEHRIILDSKTKINKITTRDVLNDIIKTTPVPKVSRVSSNG